MSTRQNPYVVGVDIGGANLKLADTNGRSCSCSFPMWRQPEQLGESLAKLLEQFPVAERLAVTMTGELADCFATRREGVAQILDQVAFAFAPEHTFVYAVGNRWLTPNAARQDPWAVAASNWYALAAWIGSLPRNRFGIQSCSSTVLLDIGSTTTDITPLRCNTLNELAIATSARTDRDRLELKQLVYTGVERTPLAAIVREVTLGVRTCPVMAERFATSDDCYLVLGLTEESAADCDTADGRPRTIAAAHARIARMVGEDAETLSIADAQLIANQVIDAQASHVAAGLEANLGELDTDSSLHVIIGGHGRGLAERAIGRLSVVPQLSWLDIILSPALSRSAPAAAVAHLLENCIVTA